MTKVLTRYLEILYHIYTHHLTTLLDDKPG